MIAALMSKIYEVRDLKAQQLVISTERTPSQPLVELTTNMPTKQKQPLISIESPQHIICFVALPFDDKYIVVLEALRDVLEVAPYCWQVERADRTYFNANIPDNISEWIARSQCFAVEISERNENVMMELGHMLWGYPEKPLIILERKDNNMPELVTDISGRLRIHYVWGENPKQERIAVELRNEIERYTALSSLRGERHYLSTRILNENWISRGVAEAIAKKYTTIEEFLSHDAVFISQDLSIGAGTLRDIQDYLRNKLDMK